MNCKLGFISLLVLFLFLQFIPISQLAAQCTPCNDPAPVGVVDYNSARISILSGANLEFNFLNIPDYKDGVTLTNHTVLGITVCNCNSTAGGDPVPGSNITGWDLFMDTDDTEFIGSDPVNTLPLCFLEAEASIRSGLAGAGVNVTGRQVLALEGSANRLAFDDVDPATITDRFWSTDQLNISYYFAVPPTNATCAGLGRNFPLINDGAITGDYYSASISFTLVPRCAVCIDVAY